jgi:hypothetical protein
MKILANLSLRIGGISGFGYLMIVDHSEMFFPLQRCKYRRSLSLPTLGNRASALGSAFSNKVIHLHQRTFYSIEEATTMRKLIIEIVTWLAIEFILNLSGLDDLGNYSEFVFAQKNVTIINSTTVTMMI